MCGVGKEIETNWFFEENNSSARASHFLVHFSARYDVKPHNAKSPYWIDENYGMRYSFQSTGRPFPVYMISHRNKILAPVQQPGWARAGMTFFDGIL